MLLALGRIAVHLSNASVSAQPAPYLANLLDLNSSDALPSVAEACREDRSSCFVGFAILQPSILDGCFVRLRLKRCSTQVRVRTRTAQHNTAAVSHQPHGC